MTTCSFSVETKRSSTNTFDNNVKFLYSGNNDTVSPQERQQYKIGFLIGTFVCKNGKCMCNF